MSYISLTTDRFDEVVHFYGAELAFPVIDQWDRPNGRGLSFDLGGGLRLEILNTVREPSPECVGTPTDRFQVVIEVDDIDVVGRRIKDAPPARTTSLGVRHLQVRDPDGVPVTFLQWIEASSEELCGSSSQGSRAQPGRTRTSSYLHNARDHKTP
jgi:catechol 2,3-dioxygenase-like lactoylglutathione lyase family enzyme